MSIESKRVDSLIKEFSRQRVLVIGDVVLDRYVVGAVERINPEAPVPVLHAKNESFSTGAAGNTAKNAASLGATAVLLSVVGDDSSAEDVRTAATSEGYEARLVTDPGRPTIEKKRYLVNGQQMLRVDYEDRHEISGAVEQELITAIAQAAPDTDFIIVSDYAKGAVTQKVAAAIMAAAKQHNVPVMADVKPSRVSYFKGATLVSPNRKEAHEYLGLNEQDNGGLSDEELAARLQDTLTVGVFLTLSSEGFFVLNEDAGVHVPQVHKIEVADTSGCGDTAAVAVCLAKLAGASDVEAAVLGNAAGAVNATKMGAQAITPEELQHMVVHDEVLHQHTV